MTATNVEPLYPSLDAALIDQVRRKGDATALVFKERRTSFAALDTRAALIAQALIASGCAAGGIVAILARNSDRYAQLLFGGARAGVIVLTLNWRLALPELDYIIADTAPDILFYDGDFADQAVALAGRTGPLRLVCLDDMPDQPGFDSWLSIAEPSPGLPAVDLPMVDPAEPAILLYTSGTTGRPKGVLISQSGLLHSLSQSYHAAHPTSPRPSDVVLLSPPLFHVGGLNILVSAVMFGSRTIILQDAKMADMVTAIETEKVTRAVIIPALMPQMVEAAASGADLRSLGTILYGMSPIPETVLGEMLRVCDCAFVQQYGMTELSGSATQLDPGDHLAGSSRLASCGRVLPGMELIIRDAAGGPAAAGVPGEVLVRSRSLFVGYWQERRRSPAELIDGWYATGDIGYLDEAGYLFLCDRKKDMIVSGGENVYSAEVEAVLHLHPDVDRAAVIGIPSVKWGEEVKAVVLLRPAAHADEGALTAFARERLAGYKVPKSIDFVSEFPLTSVGKIAKHVLRDRYWAGRARRIN